MAALVAARMREISAIDGDIDAAVTEILGPAPSADQAPAKPFADWCQKKGLPSRPASPNSVALFVSESQALGIEPLLEILRGISAAHTALGLADPTGNWPVTAALSRISNVAPPRSFPKAEKEAFQQLPYALQNYLSRRELQREAEIRRAHNEAGIARQQLAAIQKSTTEVKNGTTEIEATNADTH
jgi:hypothetical protein